jgi:hypothetical protein
MPADDEGFLMLFSDSGNNPRAKDFSFTIDDSPDCVRSFRQLRFQ